jgi:two-component system, sensor histidine kinase LadS
MARADRSGDGIAIMRIDIDHFSRINAEAGRTEGDVVLRKVAHACQKSIRSADILARSGADGFLALLSESSAEDAERAAGRLVTAACTLEAKPSAEGHAPVRVSVSIGIAARPGSGGPLLAELIRDAEQALQKAKEAGGNMVRLAADT